MVSFHGFLEWVSGVRGLFRHDATTRGLIMEVWVVVPAVLVLIQFVVGSLRPRFVIARQINPAIQLLHILSYYSVSYTLGLMKPSISKQDPASTFSVFLQVWAVLIVTVQDGARIGRPYRPKEMTLIDLLSSLWSANQLRTHTALYLKVPLWVIWTIHAFRIIWYFLSSSKAAQVIDDNMKLVSDYMLLLPRTDGHVCTATMEGYNYLVDGEDRQKKNIERPSFRFRLEETRPDELITVDKVWAWTQARGGDDRLLGTLTDGDNKFKDVCLSFALYKMLRRRFLNLPIPEAKDKALRELVADVILEDTREYERAFRVTEVELSFLQDFFYSKHAVVFAGGLPVIRPILSAFMAAAAVYLAYVVRDIPSTSIGKTNTGHMARIFHAVFVTRFLIFIVVCRELWEIGVYGFSLWTKVLILCHYIRLKLRQGQNSTLRQRMVEMLVRIIFTLVRRGQWNQKIQQHNLLVPNKGVRLRLPSEVKTNIFESLKELITRASSSAQDSPNSPVEATNNRILQSYLGNAFPENPGAGPNGPPVPSIEGIHSKLQRDTHKILIWHVATSLCQMDLMRDANIGDDLYKLRNPSADGDLPADDPWRQYNTAVTLSNYCVHLVKEALLPDNGLMASKVFHAVRAEARDALRGCRTRGDIHDCLVADMGTLEPDRTLDGTSIIKIGTQLESRLLETYHSRNELWERLGRFWVGYLLYLSASTRVATHRIHLQGRRELTTHLWALLSHAGFLGEDTRGPNDAACDG